jgi:hypothetical protein
MYSTPKKELSPERHGSAMKTTASYGSPSREYVSPIKLEEDRELVYTLKSKAGLEERLESAKCQLASQPDFNLYDAFRIFDDRYKGWMTIADLKYGLQDIGIAAPMEQIELFFKHYDSNKDGRLTFSEFCNALLPLDPYCSRMLNARRDNNIRAPPYAKDDVFMYSTKGLFKDLLRTHLRGEDEAEY